MRIGDPAKMKEARATAGRRFRRLGLALILGGLPVAYGIGYAAGEVESINAACITWTRAAVNGSETISAHR